MFGVEQQNTANKFLINLGNLSLLTLKIRNELFVEKLRNLFQVLIGIYVQFDLDCSLFRFIKLDLVDIWSRLPADSYVSGFATFMVPVF